MVSEYVLTPVAAPELVPKVAPSKEPLELVTEYTTSALVRPGARDRARVIHRARMEFSMLIRRKILPLFLRSENQTQGQRVFLIIRW